MRVFSFVRDITADARMRHSFSKSRDIYSTAGNRRLQCDQLLRQLGLLELGVDRGETGRGLVLRALWRTDARQILQDRVAVPDIAGLWMLCCWGATIGDQPCGVKPC